MQSVPSLVTDNVIVQQCRVAVGNIFILQLRSSSQSPADKSMFDLLAVVGYYDITELKPYLFTSLKA